MAAYIEQTKCFSKSTLHRVHCSKEAAMHSGLALWTQCLHFSLIVGNAIAYREAETSSQKSEFLRIKYIFLNKKLSAFFWTKVKQNVLQKNLSVVICPPPRKVQLPLNGCFSKFPSAAASSPTVGKQVVFSKENMSLFYGLCIVYWWCVRIALVVSIVYCNNIGDR